MSYFDHTDYDGDKPDWLILWWPRLMLAAVCVPMAIFLLMTFYFEVMQ